MKKTKTKNIKQTGVLLLVILAGVFTKNAFAWVEPVQAPPAGNVGAPITTSGVQTISSTGDAILNFQTKDNTWLYNNWYDSSGNRRLWTGLDGLLNFYQIQPENGTQGEILGGIVGIGTTSPDPVHKLSVAGGQSNVNDAAIYGTNTQNGGDMSKNNVSIAGISKDSAHAGRGGGVYGEGGNYGVYGYSANTISEGIYGYGVIGEAGWAGVKGIGGSYGVWGEGSSMGVYGKSTVVDGVRGETWGNFGRGVSGLGYGSNGVGIYGYGKNGVQGVGTDKDFVGSGGEYAKNGSWVNASDRNLKENFTALNGQDILSKIMKLPITQWNYKTDSSAKHIGPVAQDFYAIFGLGNDDKSISSIDPSGIALEGVKTLNEKIIDQQQQLDKQQQEIELLKSQIQALQNK